MKSYGLCMACGQWSMTTHGVCAECQDTLDNPKTPKMKSLLLDNEMAKTFRFLAQRHAPSLLGNDPSVRRMLRQDEMNRIAEEFHPLMEVTLLSLEDN